jgi:tetratricopeptide (TPR) repeat protein
MAPHPDEADLAALWATADHHEPEEFVALMDKAVEGLEPAIAAYERASARDSTGDPEQAVPLYREALAVGLGPDRRRQAVIQLASSLRNLGEVEESVRLLQEEKDRDEDDLADGVDAFLALALTSAGREREAVSVALTALARHMTRYQRSLRAYAEDLRQ